MYEEDTTGIQAAPVVVFPSIIESLENSKNTGDVEDFGFGGVKE